ncbi:DNA-binding domain-containing protein [Hydrogenophaga sp. 5NK40-0174]|uniref:DNA-binding domain-containing protein n=1 Tax=Hydrogenophaga sp. 5NK40-0174 TaxID=3127649 RepID=UPI0031056A54
MTSAMHLMPPETSYLREQQKALAALLTRKASATLGLLAQPSSGHPVRLDVYQHAYTARLVEALRANYPALHGALGDERFASLALAYLNDHPSQRPSIRCFGHRLCEWLAHPANAGHLPHPAILDLARMEWAMSLAFDAEDVQALSFDDVASTPAAHWPDLRFALAPSVQLLTLQWAVEPVWHTLTADESALEHQEATSEPQALTHTLLVWRKGLATQWRSVDNDEALLLGACAGGTPFGAWCEQACAQQKGEEAALWVAQALRRWVDDGLLVEA